MNREQVRAALYERYIAPTETKTDNYIGIEIEMPIINTEGQATDFDVAKGITEEFRVKHGFEPVSKDFEGNCYAAIDSVTGDNLSYDCSYNNLEISFGMEKSLSPINGRFTQYITELNDEFRKCEHVITGMGVNPGWKNNNKEYLPSPRYQMLEGYLKRCRDWDEQMYFHPYPDFATYACASQVQLDVTKDKLISTIQAFTLLEPVKSRLFANAWMDSEPDNLIVRDMFWENSTHGINPHNIGMYKQIPEDLDELLEYISRTSLFCTERDGHYLHFKPIPVIEYFEREYIEGEYYENGVYYPYTFTPEDSDLKYLRTYKFEDLTFRGTIEYRSGCCQPFSEAMTVAAFHVGLQDKVEELAELLKNDKVLYHHGYTPGELRKMMNRRELPGFVDEAQLKKLIMNILDIAESGLKKRGYGEEKYLAPLYRRAEYLKSPALRMVEGLQDGHKMEEYIEEYASLSEVIDYSRVV